MMNANYLSYSLSNLETSILLLNKDAFIIYRKFFLVGGGGARGKGAAMSNYFKQFEIIYMYSLSGCSHHDIKEVVL